MAAGAAVNVESLANVHAAGNDVIRVGLIGCGSPRGGRGRGAASNCVKAGPNVRLVAMADAFKDHLEFTRDYLKKNLTPDQVDVPESNCFVGFDAYQKLIDCKDIDLVILATPPGFRPAHLKPPSPPASTSSPRSRSPSMPRASGRSCRPCEEAKKKNLSVVSGLCYRYEFAKRETMQQVHDGAIGDIVALQTHVQHRRSVACAAQPEWSDMEWQMRNWLYFTWLSGDHNVEQHIHSLDKWPGP